MNRIDCNCFIGTWPFYQLENTTFPDLRRLHGRREIGGGFLSSFQAVFFNDPLDADLALAQELSGQSAYRQIVTVNPLLPGWRSDLPKLFSRFPVAGVRVVPCLHRYRINCPEMQELAACLAQWRKPLLLSVRLEDPRSTYLLLPDILPIDEIAQFLQKQKDLKILLCTLYPDEMEALRGDLCSRDNLWVDSSGIRGGLFIVEKLMELGILRRMVYGSMAPLYCLESTLLLIEQAQIPDEEKKQIFYERSRDIFHNEIVED